jgi:hypothetical protein
VPRVAYHEVNTEEPNNPEKDKHHVHQSRRTGG